MADIFKWQEVAKGWGSRGGCTCVTCACARYGLVGQGQYLMWQQSAVMGLARMYVLQPFSSPVPNSSFWVVVRQGHMIMRFLQMGRLFRLFLGC